MLFRNCAPLCFIPTSNVIAKTLVSHFAAVLLLTSFELIFFSVAPILQKALPALVFSPYGMLLMSRYVHGQECQQLEVPGPNHVANLRELPDQLPVIFLEAARKLQESSLDDALQYYADFAAYAHSGQEADSPPVTDLLPTIAEVCTLYLRLCASLFFSVWDLPGSCVHLSPRRTPLHCTLCRVCP
jgi:hypothetical protein